MSHISDLLFSYLAAKSTNWRLYSKKEEVLTFKSVKLNFLVYKMMVANDD